MQEREQTPYQADSRIQFNQGRRRFLKLAALSGSLFLAQYAFPYAKILTNEPEKPADQNTPETSNVDYIAGDSLTPEALLIAKYLYSATAFAEGEERNDDQNKPKTSKVVYITLDDGYTGLAEKLGVLRDLDIKATFFLTGEAIERNPNTVEQLLKEGHHLRNHTYSHRDLTTLTREQIEDQIENCELAAQKIGVSTKPYLRPPYGKINDTVNKVIQRLGYKSVLWHHDPLDWLNSSTEYIEARIQPGVVLLHTQGKYTAEALRIAIPRIRREGHLFGLV